MVKTVDEQRVARLLGDPSWLDRPERFSLQRVPSIRSKRPVCSVFWTLVNELVNELTELDNRSWEFVGDRFGIAESYGYSEVRFDVRVWIKRLR